MSADKKGFTFTWKIENFSMLPHQKGEALKSNPFEVDMCGKTQFMLHFFPRGDTRNQENETLLYFVKLSTNNECKMNYTLTLESTNSSVVMQKVFLRPAQAPLRCSIGVFPKINLSDIYKKKNGFLPNDILTLHFEFSLADENSTDERVIDKSVSPQRFRMKRCISHTSIRVHRSSMMWPIENINKRRGMPIVFIPVSSTVKGSPSLKLLCDLSKTSNNDYIPITICQTFMSSNKERLFVKCKMTVIGAHKECQDSAESSYLFSLELDDVFNFPPFIKTCNLTSDKYLYLDDTLFLQCEFAFCYKSDIVSLSEFDHSPLVYPTEEPSKSKFVKSLEDLYMQGKLYDVHLHAGDKVFPAYKVLLCARSNVFTAMFEHNMKEKKTNVIEITDVEPTTLKRMLDFILVDGIKEELSPEDACKLYMAADKYNIDCLKRRCSILLTSILSTANVCNILSLAGAHNDNFLMNAVNSFFSTYSTEIFNSTHWESFMDDHPKLSMKIMHQWIKEQHF